MNASPSHSVYILNF